MTEKILAALAEMDTMDDELWTADGLPKVDVVAAATGDAEITRKDITEVAPQFSRSSPLEEEELVEAPVEVDKSGSELEQWQQRQETQAYNRNHPEILKAAEAVKDMNDKLAEVQKEKVEAERHHRDMVHKYAPSGNTPKENQLSIMHHLEQQKKVRAERQASSADLMKLMKMKQKAPIDAVAARATGHGKGRKTHPKLG